MEESLEQILSAVRKIEKKVSCIDKSLKRLEDERDSEREGLREQKHVKAQLHIIQQMINRLDKVNYYSQMFQSQMKKHGSQEATTDGKNLHGDNHVHRDVLKKHIEDFVKDVNLKETYLIDKLTATSVLSEDESSELLADQNRRNQNRKLMVKLSQRSSAKFKTFLDLLEVDYPHIYDKLKKTYDEMAEIPRPTLCTICIIKRDVDLLSIADKLLQRDLIDLEIYNMISSNPVISSGPPQQHLWECVLNTIDGSKDRQTKICYLIEILSSKYDHCSAQLLKWSCERELRCWCSDESLHQTFHSADKARSTTDKNTLQNTSTANRPINNESINSPATDSIASAEENIQYTNIPRVLEWLDSVVEPEVKESDDTEILRVLIPESVQKTEPTNMQPGTCENGTFSSKELSLDNIDDRTNRDNQTKPICNYDNFTFSNFKGLWCWKARYRRSHSESCISQPCSTQQSKTQTIILNNLIDYSSRPLEGISLQNTSTLTPILQNLNVGNNQHAVNVHINENGCVTEPPIYNSAKSSSPVRTASSASRQDSNNNPRNMTTVQLETSLNETDSAQSTPVQSGKTLSRRQKRNERRRKKMHHAK